SSSGWENRCPCPFAGVRWALRLETVAPEGVYLGKIGQDALTGRAALAERLMSPRCIVMRFVGTALACVWVLADSVVAAEPVDYLRAVKPILAQHCWSCHGPTRQKSRLRLDTAA